MRWRLVIEAQAEAEIFEAAAWYGRVTGELVRRRFLDEVAASLAAIERNPLQYQIIRGGRDPKRWQGRFPR